MSLVSMLSFYLGAAVVCQFLIVYCSMHIKLLSVSMQMFSNAPHIRGHTAYFIDRYSTCCC